jgi:hypothetical protein
MTTVRRATILKMAAAAYEMKLEVATGTIGRDAGGHWRIGDRELDSWLADHQGEELVIILGSLEDERPVETRTCGTCGRDYVDLECPHCRASRIRLRGQP